MRASPDLCAEISHLGTAPTKVAQEELKKDLRNWGRPYTSDQFLHKVNPTFHGFVAL